MKLIRKHCFAIFFFILMTACVFQNKKDITAAPKAKSCTVTFLNSDSKVNGTKKIRVGSYVILPQAQRNGYKSFWCTKNGSTIEKYNPGKKIRIQKNTKFYLKYYKKYTVNFYTATGNKKYSKIKINTYSGQTIKLPAVDGKPSSKYGWSTKKNGSCTYSFNDKIKVYGNKKLYLAKKVVKKKETVNLMYSDGTKWKAINNASFNQCFPDVYIKGTEDNCTGWSRTKGKSKDPDYIAGDKIPSKSGTYYMVTFKKSQDIMPTKILTPNCDALYIVGDSRANYMMWALQSTDTLPDNVKFVAESGQGLYWFKNSGYSKLREKMDIQEGQKQNSEHIVIITLGVNDQGNGLQYVDYMKMISKELTSCYNCKLYYMSVNPLNNATLQLCSPGNTASTQGAIELNKIFYSGFCSKSNQFYTYIDTYDYLLKNGWSAPDGIHFSVNTSLRIYNYCVKFINEK